MGQQQRLIDEILNTARQRRGEQAPLRSAAQSRFMDLLSQGTPAFDVNRFQDRSNPFRAQFGSAPVVAARSALPMPAPTPSTAVDPSRMAQAQQMLAALERAHAPEHVKAQAIAKLRSQLTARGDLPG